MKNLVIAAVAACGIAAGAAEKAKEAEAAKESGKEESKFPVSVEAGISLDTKFMSYGLVDNKDPIVTPSALVKFFDWGGIGVEALFDTTKYGKRGRWEDGPDYGNRAGKYFELDPSVTVGHSFSNEDFAWIPACIGSVEFELGYSYEYHPRHMGGKTGEPGDDTQFVTLSFGLPDLWLEPAFEIERDIDRDNGTYFNLGLGHAFPLIKGAGEDDDPVLAFRPSVAQGLGTSKRTYGYGLSESHGGLMDTCVKGELTWQICEHLSLSGYVAYYDYVFDRNLRHAAREYEASGHDDTSYHFVAGIGLTASF